MKKLLFIFAIILGLSSCSNRQYMTYSAGKDNVSYILLIAQGDKLENVVVNVDDKSHTVEKVFKAKAARRTVPVVVTPGKHKVSVFYQNEMLYSGEIYVGLQETKKIDIKYFIK